MNHISAKTNANPLDATQSERYRSLVAVNPATGNASPNVKVDSRHHAAFFMSVTHYWCAFSMAGHGGEAFGPAGLLDAGLANPAMCLPPRMQAGSGFKHSQGACTMHVIRRAIRTLFPLHPVPVSTLATPYRFTMSEVTA